MKLKALVLIASLAGVQGTSPGQARKPPTYRTESSAYVIEDKSAWTFVTENRSFHFVELLNDQGSDYTRLLLEEAYHNERREDVENVRGSATVRAWTLVPGRSRTPRWTIRESGNEGQPRDRLFKITAWACCDAPVTYFYYSLLTGNKLYVSNSELLKVLQNDSGPQAERLIGFGYAGDAGLDQPPRLQYGTDTKIIQRFSIVSSRKYFDAPRAFVSTNGKLETSLDLRGSSPNFAIVLRYEDGVEIRIPVEGDIIRSEKAVVPQGYSILPEK